ncbi:pleckstrin homology domain-containing family O member 2 isoform X2 [Hemicordylus capensis]|uniref:pleckstrin homology domain-containing family O member 2 isoform X2 n=1 Tax=Hemicordylus capensis TaxID=884348 RepID=UPI00230369BB|nr:pleckstrin homology domain-containing family O member 2 isoform X2 [Hemicordylus capensis]
MPLSTSCRGVTAGERACPQLLRFEKSIMLGKVEGKRINEDGHHHGENLSMWLLRVDTNLTGVKEETPAKKPKSASTADKAGWIKKSSGGLLGLWKERYILLCKTQLLVYEDEDEQKCIETVELESYEKCQELRALLKRRNRFILIRSPGYKVHDIKFQASNGEEKESWMKALNEGINRGKNRVFDEVKVDDSLSLEHVTRDRAKLGQGRRPPTRYHRKEVAEAASDGILRLDLDVTDSGPPNATVGASEAENVPPPKEVFKPPMPPMKPLMHPTEKQTPDSAPEDLEVKKPPMPPSKPLKEIIAPGDMVSPAEDEAVASEDAGQPKAVPDEDKREGSMEANRNIPEGPVPPLKILSNKATVTVTWDDPASESQSVEAVNPSPAGSKENLHEAAQGAGRPPTPPPKIISERLRATINVEENSLEAVTSESDHPGDNPTSPVNGVVVDDDGTTEPLSEEHILQDGEERSETPSEQGTKKEGSSLCLQDQVLSHESAGDSVPAKAHCNSLGGLLAEPKKKPFSGQDLQRGGDLHVARMEKKVACEQERTEQLLQKVLQEGLEQAPEGNGPPGNAKTLLSEAVEQLRQASQVLQEIKDLEEQKKEPAERRKGALPKDLATLYRRSAP